MFSTVSAWASSNTPKTCMNSVMVKASTYNSLGKDKMYKLGYKFSGRD